MLSSVGNYHSGPAGGLQAGIQLLLGLKICGGDWLARRLPAGFENGRIGLLAACWGSIWVQLVSRSHCHYVITMQPVLVLAHCAHHQTPDFGKQVPPPLHHY